MGSHSILPPSSASIWGKPNGCTGWVLMSQMYPETEETPEAAEGTAVHEIGANMIAHAVVGNFPSSEMYANTLAITGVPIDQDMIDGAEMYANDVGEVMRKTGNFVPQIEQPIKAPRVNALSYGTPDCWLFDKGSKHLYIWDFKYGYGVIEAFENWQLINYVAGILDTLGVPDTEITVHFRIVQPRAFHRNGPVREWIVNAADLRGCFNILEANARAALGTSPVTRSGSHCKDCSARHACSEALRGGIQLYEVAGQPLPMELPPDALSVQLAIVKRAIKQLEYIESGLSEQVTALIKSGTLIPGWMLEQGQGREKWAKPVVEVLALGDQYHIDLRKPIEAITPKQAVGLGIDRTVINQYSITPSTGLKLAPDSGNKARELFNHD